MSFIAECIHSSIAERHFKNVVFALKAFDVKVLRAADICVKRCPCVGRYVMVCICVRLLHVFVFTCNLFLRVGAEGSALFIWMIRR